MTFAETLGGTWHDIATAPRDGTEVWVLHEDCGAFPMRWNPSGFNPLVSTEHGIWEAPNGGFTWSEENDGGPSHWRHIEPGDFKRGLH
jgi:hypothetical protein